MINYSVWHQYVLFILSFLFLLSSFIRSLHFANHSSYYYWALHFSSVSILQIEWLTFEVAIISLRLCHKRYCMYPLMLSIITYYRSWTLNGGNNKPLYYTFLYISKVRFPMILLSLAAWDHHAYCIRIREARRWKGDGILYSCIRDFLVYLLQSLTFWHSSWALKGSIIYCLRFAQNSIIENIFQVVFRLSNLFQIATMFDQHWNLDNEPIRYNWLVRIYSRLFWSSR